MTSKWKFALSALAAVTSLAASPLTAHAQEATASQSVAVPTPAFVPSRIVAKIDDSKLVALRGNVHPGAVSANERGALAASTQMNRIVLVLQRSPEQDAALDQFMAEQKDPSSPNFHRWLTPEEFGATYGISDQDLATVTGWLQSHGFTIDNVSKGRVTIEFSGTAAAVQQAFHTQMNNYVVNGVAHIANNSDPQIPEALAPVVQGIASLHNFFPQHQHVLGDRVMYNMKTHKVTPLTVHGVPTPLAHSNLATAAKLDPDSPIPQLTYTNDDGNLKEDLTPYDFATIYNVLPLWNAGINGTGVNIAISGASDITLSDIAKFQSAFGLPSNPPTVIHNGADPGEDPDGAGENELDVEWSGAVAPKAKILFVVTGSTQTTFGGQLSDSYIVDNKTANIMSASYGMCELKLGSSGNAAYNKIWQQGAAEGISIMESSGDQGSAGCSSQDTAPPNADSVGLAVNGMASSPFVTAVGGTDFYWQAAPSTYWNSSNTAGTGASAKGYVTEEVWNSTCASNYITAYFGEPLNEQTCNDALNDPEFSNLVVIAAGSGGISNCTTPSGTTIASCSGGYAKPSWQTGTGVPADGKRDLPDVSLFASSGLPDGLASSGYLVCETINGKVCNYGIEQDIEMQEIGGTSASSPAFAGIMALVLQKTGEAQGLANVEFYKFAASENLTNCKSASVPVTGANSCIFYDVTLSNNAQACITGDPNCVTNTSGDELGILSGYNAGVGYDRATGLGSVNVTNLVNAAWPKAGGGGTAQATLSPTTLAFGNQTVGVKSAAKTATLKNGGTATLTGIAITQTGATSSFTETNTCSTTLAAGASCTFTVTFDPSAAIAKTLTVTIKDSVGTQTLEATGTGVASSGSVAFTPTSLPFGNQTVGVKSAAKTTVLKNTTGVTVTGLTISTSGATSSFAETNNCTSTLANNASCTFTLTFDPSGAVAKTLTITAKDSAGAQTLVASGTGVAAGGTIAFSPSTLAFGNETVGVKSAAKTATLTNNTAAAVTGLTIATSGATSSFAETTSCTSSLAKGASCTFTLTFDPNGAVAKTFTISVKDSAGTQTLEATGTGVN
jgi:subtilase family serine protease